MRVHEVDEEIDDPEVALQMLKYGNKRFVEGNLMPKEAYKDELAILDHGQTPFAVIVGCSDSRVAPEVLFDQMLGDLFVVRSAGNVIDCVGMGSIEYAVEHLKTPLVVVMGHDHCGAVTAACLHEDEFSANIKLITDMIEPSYQKILKHVEAHSKAAQIVLEEHIIEATTLENVFAMTEIIRQSELVKKFKVLVVPAKFHINTGEVQWYDFEN